MSFAAAFSLSGCGNKIPNSTSAVGTLNAADSIYFGGGSLTMEGETPQYVEALVVKDGKIVFVGSKAEADKLKGPTPP